MPANGTATVGVTITADPKPPSPVDGFPDKGLYGGYLVFTGGGGRKFRVPYAGFRGGVVDVEQSAGGVMLEPLADVALRRTGALGQLGRGGGAVVGERAVQAESFAEVDRVDLQGRAGIAQQSVGEGIGAVHDWIVVAGVT